MARGSSTPTGTYDQDSSISSDCDGLDLFEVGSDSNNLVYEIFDGQDVILADSILDDRVIG